MNMTEAAGMPAATAQPTARYVLPLPAGPTQITTSCEPVNGVRSAPRLVARIGILRSVSRTDLPSCASVSVTAPAPTEIAPTPIEGSGGLLLEIDGKIVPNYAATMVSFSEIAFSQPEM